ncbi:MAG: thioredoxin [Anaerolineales bacterium]|nr:MAG: thioredoxin [Anaerolineales bacterium]
MIKHKEVSCERKSGLTRWQVGVVVSVLILIVAVLILKNMIPSVIPMVDNPDVNSLTITAESKIDGARRELAPLGNELPAAHLERMLSGRHPIFAFFHSTTCTQCVEMTKIVNQIYPAFENQVALVDVDVYDERNQALLQQAGIRIIPTLVFFDQTGTAQGFTGVMPADELKAILDNISSGGFGEP